MSSFTSVQAREIDVIADIVQFRGAAGLTRWEFHYAVPDTTFTYALDTSGYEGELFCELVLVNEKADSSIDQWITAAKALESKPPHRHFFTGVRNLELLPGHYTAKLSVRDLVDTSRKLLTTFDTDVRAFGTRIDLSDIMFTLSRREGAGQNFTRNSVDAAPNPRHEMVGTDPSISIYMECYQALANHVDTLGVKFEVLDYVKRDVMTSYSKLIGSSNGLVIREDIPAGALRTGVYSLVVSVLSKDLAETFASREERFYILNPELPPEGYIVLTEEQRFMNSEWAVLVGDQLKLEIELSNVLATRAEKITLEGLKDERAQQRYLYRFWQTRDPDPSTSVNERLDEFRKMYARAQAFYSSAVFRDGWRTDRGITLLRYGVPTQIIQHIQTIDTKPYEEWFYQNLQGGAYFYFVDMQLMQNHQLVHSTLIGEIRNENWFNQYARAFQPDPNPTRSLLPTAR